MATASNYECNHAYGLRPERCSECGVQIASRCEQCGYETRYDDEHREGCPAPPSVRSGPHQQMGSADDPGTPSGRT